MNRSLVCPEPEAHGGAPLTDTDSERSPAHVLIVDESDDCREVLRTLLEYHGVATLEAREARQGLTLLRRHRPSVVVLDLDAEAADDEQIRQQYTSGAEENNTALVVLGRARRTFDGLPAGRVISKPYHYAPLIRTIERLLER